MLGQFITWNTDNIANLKEYEDATEEQNDTASINSEKEFVQSWKPTNEKWKLVDIRNLI